MEKNQHAVFQFLKKKESVFFESNKSKIAAELPRFHGKIFYLMKKPGLLFTTESNVTIFCSKISFGTSKSFCCMADKSLILKWYSEYCEVKVNSLLHGSVKTISKGCLTKQQNLSRIWQNKRNFKARGKIRFFLSKKDNLLEKSWFAMQFFFYLRIACLKAFECEMNKSSTNAKIV